MKKMIYNKKQIRNRTNKATFIFVESCIGLVRIDRQEVMDNIDVQNEFVTVKARLGPGTDKSVLIIEKLIAGQ